MNKVVCLLAFSLTFGSTISFADQLDAAAVQCASLGRAFAASFEAEYSADGLTTSGNPEFHYSNRLGTCLAFTEITTGLINPDIETIWHYRRITDVLSNRVLAYSRFFVHKEDPFRKVTLVDLANVGEATNLLPDDFDARKALLFSE